MSPLAKRTTYALALLCALGLSSSALAIATKGAVTKVQKRNQRLLTRFQEAAANGMNPQRVGRGCSAKVQTVKIGKERFILRDPRREMNNGMQRGVERSVRVNNALQVLAVQLGEERMVPGAVAATMPNGGRKLMLMSHVGAHYLDGDRASSQQFAAVPQRQRLVGALLDVLSRQMDRKNENVMVHDADGKARMPDPDNTFGVGHGRGWAYSSVFYKGNALGYSGQQNSLKDLPPEMAEVITYIAKASRAEIKAIYGLGSKEGGYLQKQAQDIVQSGLDGAVRLFNSQYTIHNPG